MMVAARNGARHVEFYILADIPFIKSISARKRDISLSLVPFRLSLARVRIEGNKREGSTYMYIRVNGRCDSLRIYIPTFLIIRRVHTFLEALDLNFIHVCFFRRLERSSKCRLAIFVLFK